MMDKYTAGIEVSNACRQFYVSRLQTAELLKERLVAAAIATDIDKDQQQQTSAATHHNQLCSSFDSSVAHLRSELASLIDLDLQVMRQLLMLNEQVEELKWQRRQQSFLCSTATPAIDELTSGSMDGDRPLWLRDCWSADVSFGDRSLSRDYCFALSKYPTPSTLSLLNASSQDQLSTNCSCDTLDRTENDVFPNDAASDCAAELPGFRPVRVRFTNDADTVMSTSFVGVKPVNIVKNSAADIPAQTVPQRSVTEAKNTENDAPPAQHQALLRKRSSGNGSKERPATKPKPIKKPISPTVQSSNVMCFITNNPVTTELLVKTGKERNNNRSSTASTRKSSTTSNESMGSMSPVSPTARVISEDGKTSRNKQQPMEAHSRTGSDSFQEFSAYVEMLI